MNKYDNIIPRILTIIFGSLLMLAGIIIFGGTIPLLLLVMNSSFWCGNVVTLLLGMNCGIYAFSVGFRIAIINEPMVNTGWVNDGNSMFEPLGTMGYYRLAFITNLIGFASTTLISLTYVIFTCLGLMDNVGATLIFCGFGLVTAVFQFLFMLRAREELKK